MVQWNILKYYGEISDADEPYAGGGLAKRK